MRTVATLTGSEMKVTVDEAPTTVRKRASSLGATDTVWRLHATIATSAPDCGDSHCLTGKVTQGELLPHE